MQVTCEVCLQTVQCASEPPFPVLATCIVFLDHLQNLHIHAMRAKFQIVFSLRISDQNALCCTGHSDLWARPEAGTLGSTGTFRQICESDVCTLEIYSTSQGTAVGSSSVAQLQVDNARQHVRLAATGKPSLYVLHKPGGRLQFHLRIGRNQSSI